MVNFPGHEFLGTKPRFKRRNTNLSSCVYGLPKTLHTAISRGWSCNDGKEMFKKVCCTCRVVVLLIKPGVRSWRQSRSSRLIQFVECCQIFLELNSKGLYQSSGKETEGRCLVFTSSTRREIRQLHVVIVQRRQRNVQKSVLHV